MTETTLPTRYTQIPAYLMAIGAVTVMQSAGTRGDLGAFAAVMKDVHDRFNRPDHASVALRHLSRVYDRAFVAALKARTAA